MLIVKSSCKSSPIWSAQELSDVFSISCPHNAYGISIDSRSIDRGDAFFAIRGQRYDGNNYALDAYENGASVVFVERELGCAAEVIVDDGYQALCRLAHASRSRITGSAIGVTGSVGKTHAKESIAHVLNCQKNHGNLNNNIGLPLSLARMTSHSNIVCEVGISTPDEMKQNADILQPDIAIITNVHSNHIGNFPDRDSLLHEKAKIVSEHTRLVITSSDDIAKCLSSNVTCIKFGHESSADYRLLGHEVANGLRHCYVKHMGEVLQYHVPMFGRQWIYSGLIAVIVGREFGYDMQYINTRLSTLKPIDRRGIVHNIRISHDSSITVIDDSYNASIESMRLSIESVSEINTGRKLVVLGDMKELGENSEHQHRILAKEIIRNGMDLAILYGDSMRVTYDALRKEGFYASHFMNIDDLTYHVRTIAEDGDVILVKGSHANELCLVVDSICALCLAD